MTGSIRTLEGISRDSALIDQFHTSNTKDIINQLLFDSIQLPPSPVESSSFEPSQYSSPSSPQMEDRRTMRRLSRGTPGDQEAYSQPQTPEQREIGKKRSHYFGDIFANREPNSSARERVARDSMITAEVRTNVIVQDEYTFITDLSYSLSSRYQRPESSILVTLDHSACLLFGGTFDPAYTMTITALPSQIQPVTNKRNAALLQRELHEALGVVPERGVIRFVGVAEENLATNGRTVAAEIEELEKDIAVENASLRRSLSRNRPTGMPKQGSRSMRNLRNPLPTHNERLTPPLSEADDIMPAPQITRDRMQDKGHRMGRRRSFMAAVFGRS